MSEYQSVIDNNLIIDQTPCIDGAGTSSIQGVFHYKEVMIMAEQKRDFKGVWIPKEVWLDSRLSMLEKGILTEIDSLDMSEKGCYASNKHIADFCQCSETKVSTAVSKLVKLGYLYVNSFDGRQRTLKSRLSNFERQSAKKEKADLKDLKQSNTYSNPVINPNNKKESKKENKTSYDSILSEIENEELKETYLEFIKMRKLGKAPMTDRALRLLIEKVNKLEPGNVERQKLLLETAIMNGWKSVYPLKDRYPQRNFGANGIAVSDEPSDLGDILK